MGKTGRLVSAPIRLGDHYEAEGGPALILKILISDQIEATLRSIHPDQRKAIRRALAGLAKHEGDRKQLVGTLQDYYRLRIGRYRVVYCYRERHIEAVYLEERSIVYELFRP